jgi:hypothetical protein
MLVTLSSCAHKGGVTEIDPCVEIPFVDGAEGACTNTVTHKSYLVNAKDWAKLRPTMIMIRASDWTKIKKDWLKACRMMVRDGDKCNVALSSVDDAVMRLDKVISTIVP